MFIRIISKRLPKDAGELNRCESAYCYIVFMRIMLSDYARVGLFSNHIVFIYVQSREHYRGVACGSKDMSPISAQADGLARPVLILMFDGKEYKRYSKYVSIAELKADIDRLSSLYYED